MGSILVTDETLINIYRCGTCQGVFKAQVGLGEMSCCVNHAPGDCCHCFEEPVSEEMLRAVREMLARPVEEPVAVWDNGDDIHAFQTSTVTDGLESSSDTVTSESQ